MNRRRIRRSRRQVQRFSVWSQRLGLTAVMGAVLALSGVLWTEVANSADLPAIPGKAVASKTPVSTERRANAEDSLVVVMDEWEATKQNPMSKKKKTKQQRQYDKYVNDYFNFYTFFFPTFGANPNYDDLFNKQFNQYWFTYYQFVLMQKLSATPGTVPPV